MLQAPVAESCQVPNSVSSRCYNNNHVPNLDKVLEASTLAIN